MNQSLAHVNIITTVDHQYSDQYEGIYQGWGKRPFDMVLVFLVSLVFLPIIGFLWCLIRLDGGSGFYFQNRVGRNGKIFKCWKLRSMVMDADALLESYLIENPSAKIEWEKDHKLHDDPRITSIGKFLRTSSLDELPQLWNVICGEMSLVGPRPVTHEELIKYGQSKAAYLGVTPGITGLWQVSGRNNVSYAHRVRLDVRYVQNMSLLLDLKLLIQTGFVVLRRTGI